MFGAFPYVQRRSDAPRATRKNLTRAHNLVLRLRKHSGSLGEPHEDHFFGNGRRTPGVGALLPPLLFFFGPCRSSFADLVFAVDKRAAIFAITRPVRCSH